MATDDIRSAIRTDLLTIAGLGGPGADKDRHIHKYSFEVDDEKEAKQFWQSTDGLDSVVNGVMLTRLNRDDEELVAGREFIIMHRFRLLFRFGKRLDPLAEKRFEVFLDAIHEKIRANSFFKQGGLHPQPHSEQTAKSTITNKKLFHTRVWEAEIEFTVTEQIFQDSFA